MLHQMQVLIEVLKRLWDPVATPVAAALAFFVPLLLRWYQRRLTTLTWLVQHESLALSGQDPVYGEVQVLYKGTPVHNLHWSTSKLRTSVLVTSRTSS
jgi:hypothetical protein